MAAQEHLLQDQGRTAPSEADYERFCATVMTTARGRWFLAEYARRHRKTDTAAVLDALHKIEDMVRGRPEPALDRLRDEMRALAALVRDARRDLATTGGAVSDATKVMVLLDTLTEKIDFALTPGDDRVPLLLPPEAEPLRPRLVTAPPPPTPAPAPQSVLPPLDFSPMPARSAPVPAAARAHVIPMPVGKPAEAPPLPVVAISADDNYVPYEFEPMAQELPPPPAAMIRPNVYADVMALTEAERIALFS